MRWLKRVVTGLLVVCVVLAAAWTWSRLRGPTPGQRAALAVLEAPNTFAGRNAFDAVWLLGHDVPEPDIAAVADADIRALAASVRSPGGMPAFTTSAAAYPDLRPVKGALAACGIRDAGCLARVSGAVDDYAALVRANAKLIERVEALSAYGHYASRLPADARVPFPEFTLLGWPLTAHALRFAQGDRMHAVEATCRDLSTWRRIGANSDALIVRMLGIALATDAYGALLADMLAAMPRDGALPSACDAALAAPAAIEASICPAMRGEFAWSMAAVDAMPGIHAPNAWSWLVLDRESYRGLLAERLAGACMPGGSAREDHPPVAAAAAVRPAWRRFECLANSAGCVLADIAGPSYTPYMRRGQDQNARLQLLVTLAWLRAQPDDGTLVERIARRPDALRNPARDIAVGAAGRTLEIGQYEPGDGATWSLPLPDYLVETGVAPD